LGKRSQVARQKWIVKQMSDGEVWTNRRLYSTSIDHFQGGMKGFSSFRGMCALLGQMSRSTNLRISETHEIIKVGEGRNYPQEYSSNLSSSCKFVEYILQERA